MDYNVNINFHGIANQFTNGPRRDNTCLPGFQQSDIQISLLSYRDKL